MERAQLHLFGQHLVNIYFVIKKYVNRTPLHLEPDISLLRLSIYSRCSYLEHRVSVKRFVSLQFLNLKEPVGLLARDISTTQDRYLHRTTQTQNKRRQIAMP
jgi:hypothetical protein